ncbi:FAD-dependent monooxygenase [Pseudanabaena sp. PCC 6802]|uniref:FAD-dependent monooxygenase n=1 Tax=Pseudanabaena sp. PCC 6802 TaxID=118173 RepID=UPI00034A41C4|nr:FAD-dependent monooxygenase [Pseudanabaena sp. PCC 6802]
MFDVLIVGAGMVGASLACALGDKNNPGNRSLKVGIIEARSDLLQGQFGADGRASAIALGSSYIWQNIGVWDAMYRRGVTPMHCVQVSDGDYPHKVKLLREDVGKEALGYIVENRVTQESLWEFMRECSNIEWICPAKIKNISWVDADGSANLGNVGVQLPAQDSAPATHLQQSIQVQINSDIGDRWLSAKLLVAADGGRSIVRQLAGIPTSERLYNQTCIVVTVKHEYPHCNTAYERFQSSGPFAILPLSGDRSCIVWTATSAEAPVLMALDEVEFMRELSKKFGGHLGKLTLETRYTERATYVPRWMHAQTYIQPRLALIGDAAHTTHPVAGQGMNLGIRDVSAIAEILLDAYHKGEDIGSTNVLTSYQTRRRLDNLGVITVTDLTNRLFSNQFILFKWMRRVGLAILTVKPFKQLLMYFMMGLASREPHLSVTLKNNN